MAIDLMEELTGEGATADAGAVENAAKFSGMIPPGKYPAIFDGFQTKEIGEGTVCEFEFKLTGGPAKGMKVRYSLFTSVKETDKDGRARSPEDIEQLKAKIKNEYWHTAGALGLAIKVTKDGKQTYQYADPKSRDFRDRRGVACIVETRLRKYKDKVTGEDKETAEVKMFGVSPATPGTATVGGTTAPAAQRDLKDLC